MGAFRLAERDGMLTIARGAGDLDLITWVAPPGAQVPGVVLNRAYEELVAALTERRAVVLLERLFGEVAAAPAVLATRASAVASSRAFALPPTWVEGAPCAGGVAGFQVVAARPTAAPRLLVHRASPCGLSVEGDEATYVGLSDVGRLLLDEGCRGPATEAEAILSAAAEVLAEAGCSFHDVLRTWFYLDRILDWYDEFNRVRNRAFRRFGLLNGSPAPLIPASTGIRGRNPRGSWCTLDLLAARPRSGCRHRVERLSNPCQNEAPEYGSAFSRGLRVTTQRCRYLLVSGTAAIDAAGASRHRGDFPAQARDTLDTVASLLEEAGSGLEEVGQATAFVKRAEDAAALADLLSRRGLDGVPVVTVVGDVCRKELLFELDATVVQSLAETTGAE